jgi:hypothetical protein
MVDSCGITGGYNLFVDIAAPDGGDGSQANPWNDLDEAIDNIGSFNQNFDGFIYLNINPGTNNVYPVTAEKISFLSNTVLRSYSSGDYNNWQPTPNRPTVRFTATNSYTPTLIHLDNFGANNIIIESQNSDLTDVGGLAINYSYVQTIDTDWKCSLTLNSSRVNVDNTINTNLVTFTTASNLPNIILTKGAMLIIGANNWTLNGAGSDVLSIWFTGGVLVSNQETVGTSVEPQPDIRAIGYYSAYNSVAIDKPDPSDLNHLNPKYVLALKGDGTAQAGWFPAECDELGCGNIDEEFLIPNVTDGSAWRVFFQIYRVKSGQTKKLVITPWVFFSTHALDNAVVTTETGFIPARFCPEEPILMNVYRDQIHFDSYWPLRVLFYPDGHLQLVFGDDGHHENFCGYMHVLGINRSRDPSNFDQRGGGVLLQSLEYTPLNND